MAILSVYYLGESVTKRDVFFLCTAFFGIIVIFMNQEFSLANKNVLGMLLIPGESILYATLITIFKKHETSFSNWDMIYYFNFIGPFVFLPFLFLMSRHIKRNPRLLALGCGWVMVMHWLDLFWYIMPRIAAETAILPMMVLSFFCTLGLFGFFLAALAFVLRNCSLVPERDPRLVESLVFENF